jgi:hypothetical protein
MFRTFILAAVLSAAVQSAFAIVLAGGVFEDPQGLAARSSFTPLAGVTVKLYRDGSVAAMATTKTDATGHFVFNVDARGTYWVAVDSKTVRASGAAPAPTAWAEQTYGPPGAICAQPEGEPRRNFVPDVCIGGRTVDGSDDASTLATSEHVAQVDVADAITNLDFGFSFNMVSRVDDVDAPRQGTLRQFVVNANAIEGPNMMRFAPIAKPPVQEDPIVGVQYHWWKIDLVSPLPAIRDAATIIDGTAYSYLSPASRVDVNPGHLGDSTWVVGALHPDRPRQEKPELEIVAKGTEGIACEARCTLRAFAIHGTPTTIAARADALLEQIMVGARPSGTGTTTGVIGISIEKGTTTTNLSHVSNQSTAGISTVDKAKLDAHALDVQRCGSGAAGAGIVLQSDGSSIVGSSIQENFGAGIVLGSPTEVRPAAHNTIADSVIASSLAGIVIGPGVNDNLIARNDIVWNRLGGVVVAPFETSSPMRNRITMNRYDENGGRPIVLDLSTPMNALWRGEVVCQTNASRPNAGIVPPVVSSARVSGEQGQEVVDVTGRACPGQTVEIYQSYVTSGVREKTETDLPLIRPEVQPKRETLVIEQDSMRAMPSIGEFNHIGSTIAKADGTFEVQLPFNRPLQTTDRTLAQGNVLNEHDIHARALSAIAIDASGNTSELSSRRTIEGKLSEKRE